MTKRIIFTGAISVLVSVGSVAAVIVARKLADGSWSFDFSSSELPHDDKKPAMLQKLGAMDFESLSKEYTVAKSKIDVFMHNNSKDYYVNINQAINVLNGFFDTGSIKLKSNKDGVITYTVGNHFISFDTNNEAVSFDDADAFEFTKTTQNTDYGQYLQYKTYNSNSLLSDNNSAQINLNKYNIDVLSEGDNLFLPISVFNLMFCSPNYYNLQFNGSKFLGVDYKYSRARFDSNMPQEYIDFYRKGIADTKQSRLNNYNFMALLFDNYYGLANSFFSSNNATDFYEYTQNIGIKNKLLSTDYNVYKEAYQDFIYGKLNELHSRIISKSFAEKSGTVVSYDGRDKSQKRTQFSQRRDQLEMLREQNNINSRVVHIYDDTARIVFNSFEVGDKDELKQDDKWRYDTYWLFDAALAKIKNSENASKIKNIVLDISLNGGGSSAALQKSLGFLTNKPVHLYIQDRLSQKYDDLSFVTDTNRDGKYNSYDGYTQYNWFVLAGLNTFSAANLFTHVAKADKLATVIGNKSGGGMFAILPTVLPDGTNIDISSSTAYSGKSNSKPTDVNELPYTEDGVEPDIYLNYEDYYSTRLLDKIREWNQKNHKDQYPKKTELISFGL
ncbi:S41 family peptidase [Mycoplasma simbae]|uniref:S41 family peptidase n=1 Tax=Mycoplasma simbae TaxID=36744 RepID=UPI000495E183|nr:S41 family peptidase [Mycoplasma simbae]